MKRKLLLIINLIIIFSMLIPAGGLASVNLRSDEATDVFLPLIQKNAGGDPEPIIPDTTKVLTEDTTQHLVSISTDGAIFTFDQTTIELDKLESGDIIVSDVSPVAPNGFLL